MVTSQKIPSYMKEAVPPPQLEKDTIVEAAIVSITRVEGQYGPQIQFDLKLGDGYQARAWVKDYETPSVASKLGQLCILIEREVGQSFQSVDGALRALKSLGKVFLEVTGHRDFNDQPYPKFAIVTSKLPTTEPYKPASQPSQGRIA